MLVWSKKINGVAHAYQLDKRDIGLLREFKIEPTYDNVTLWRKRHGLGAAQ